MSVSLVCVFFSSASLEWILRSYTGQSTLSYLLFYIPPLTDLFPSFWYELDCALLRRWYASTIPYTSLSTLLTLHFSHYTSLATLLTLHFSHYTSLATLLTLDFSHYTSHTALLSLHFSRYTSHTILLPQPFSHYVQRNLQLKQLGKISEDEFALDFHQISPFQVRQRCIIFSNVFSLYSF
jgi:hypothetical protein